jgi:ankyrin repeat protein
MSSNTPTPSVPAVPSDVTLDQLKRQAKRLLKSFRDGSADARQQFSQHPQQVPADNAQLTDAQLVLARALGADSWPRLRRHVLGRDLRQAIWNGDAVSVCETIDEEADILNDAGQHPRWGGRPTALQLAAERGQVEIVRILVERGADRQGDEGEYGWTPLQLAAHWGHTEVVDLLLREGEPVDIFSAALLGDGASVRRLLDEDPSRATTSGLGEAPPIHVATTREVVDLLLQHGARVDTIDSMGNTPVASAIDRGEACYEVAEFLLEHGATATPCELAALGQTGQLLQLLNADGGAIDFVGNIGLNAVRGTPLLAAVHTGKVATVQALLERGADATARADMGQTSLHLTGSAVIAQLLIDAGAEPTAVDDEHGTTPLTWARVGIDIQGDSPERQELVKFFESLEQS